MRPARVGVSTTGAINTCYRERVYHSLLTVSYKFRLYHHLYRSKESGALGTFFCSRLLVLVVERSLNPLRASLLIALCSRKVDSETVRYPSNSPDFQSELPLKGTLSIRNVGRREHETLRQCGQNWVHTRIGLL